jgi:hypothetical protein
MGGVDRADENIDKYWASIHGKKWYLSPILFCFELVLQNAWQMHKTYDEKVMDSWGFVDVWCAIIWRPMVILQNLAEKEEVRSVTLTHVMMA